MSSHIPAIYSAGAFHPLVPLTMAEGTHVQVEISETEYDPPSGTDIQNSWREFLKQVESLPDPPPTDGLTNRDHDKILYGK
jgi:predicted DNA-binding antitoxin AbrB/MazE fold protein